MSWLTTLSSFNIAIFVNYVFRNSWLVLIYHAHWRNQMHNCLSGERSLRSSECFLRVEISVVSSILFVIHLSLHFLNRMHIALFKHQGQLSTRDCSDVGLADDFLVCLKTHFAKNGHRLMTRGPVKWQAFAVWWWRRSQSCRKIFFASPSFGRSLRFFY